MPHSRPGSRRCRPAEALRALLLAGSVLAMVRPVQAQDMELRGEVSDPAILRAQEARARQATEILAPRATGIATPAYQPISTGAVPEAPATVSTGSIFDGPATADAPDNVEATPLPRRLPNVRLNTADESDEERPAKADSPKGEPAVAGLEEPDDKTGSINPRVTSVDTQSETALDRGAERAAAIESREAQTDDSDDDPFAPLGIRVGSFTLRPSIQQGITATSNADSSPDGKSALLSETTLRFNAASDWARNSALISGYGIFRKTLSGDEVEDALGRVDGTLDIDLDHDWRAVGKLGYEAAPESASSPVTLPGTASRPLRQTFDGSLGIEKDIGKLRFGLTGAVERDIYGDADLSNGGTLSQKDRNSTLYSATLRGGYEISPALTPFAEAEIGRRVYDQHIDESGFERSSDRVGLRAGLELDFGEKLGGEISAGWVSEKFDDNQLGSIDAPTLAAELNWSPQRGTIVGLRGTTALEDTTSAGESGSVLYSGRLTAQRRIRANLTGEAALGADWRDYSGSAEHDLILSAEASLTWWLNRYAGITTRARHETVTSSLAGRGSQTNSVFVGLTLQR